MGAYSIEVGANSRLGTYSNKYGNYHQWKWLQSIIACENIRSSSAKSEEKRMFSQAKSIIIIAFHWLGTLEINESKNISFELNCLTVVTYTKTTTHLSVGG